MARTSTEPAGAHPRAVDARRPGAADAGAGPRADEGSRSADPHRRPCASAKRSTRPAIGRSPPTTRRWRRTPTPTSSIQALLTLNTLKVAGGQGRDQGRCVEANKTKGVQLVATDDPQPGGARAVAVGLEGVDGRLHGRGTGDARQGRTIYKRSLLRLPRRRRPRRAGAGGSASERCARRRSPRRRACSGIRTTSIKALLHGLTGPVNGATYTEVMIPMGQNPTSGCRRSRPTSATRSAIVRR